MSIKPIFETVEELKANLDNVSIENLQDELNAPDGLLLVDIREIQETIDLGTIPGAIHAPRGMLEFWADPASPYYRDYFTEDKRIVVFCAGGGRSAFAAKALIDMGFRNVGHLEAGFNGWAKAGGAVEEVASTSRWMRRPKEERPPMWIGHASLKVADLDASREFFRVLGLRDVPVDADLAIFELRGGTHLILRPISGAAPAPGHAPFDLMVDDVDATHARLMDAGLEPGEIARGEIHDSFSITEPGGHAITINSSHVVGPV